MKTQISRYSHNAKKHYSGVYQQQGRMITDADWNALVDVTKERIAQALHNVIGSGVPRNMPLQVVDNAGTLRIHPGRVYVDGVLAQLEAETDALGFDAQADLPLPNGVAPGANSRVYADVWERSVVSLEDSELRDPGLHGADTCSRSQAMCQIKWCADSLDPESDGINNPPIGNAELEVVLPDFAADVSQADPCLTEAVDQPRIGDYLFRLELHSISFTQNGNTTTATLTLKWSTENGAEHYGLVWRDQDGNVQRDTSQLPPDFSAGNWAYEFYTDSSEKHLGNHLNTDYTPLHGAIQTDLNTIPNIGTVQADYVRRWDGYLTFSMSREAGQPWVPDTETIEGVEKGQAITLNATPVPAHVSFSSEGNNAVMDLVLQGLILKLRLNDYNFVRGDYWLAVVRQGAAYYQAIALDERVRCLNDGLPLGVRHHYLTLAELDGSGNLIVYESGSVKDRQLDFPPLSNLSADRVGYDPTSTQARWQDIKDTNPSVLPNTVQEAIDDLVNNLESSDIGYVLPSCAVNQSVLNLLATVPGWPDLDNDTRTTLKDMITGLLCHLDARTIPYTTAAAQTLHDVILNKLTGGLITGDLAVTGKTDVGGDLNVAGMTVTSRFRMTNGLSGTPQPNYVITAEDSNGNASWKPAPGAAWQLQPDGDLVTDPALVTNNVGINTPSPNARLHVRGNVIFGDVLAGNTNQNTNIVNILVGENSTGNQNGISFYENTSNYGMKMGYDGSLSGANNAVHFYNDGNTPVFSVLNGGRVGIGTGSAAADLPKDKLHVVGNILATGAVFSNPVLAENSVSGTISRSASGYAAVPGFDATVYVPRNGSVNVSLYFTRLVLPIWVTDVTFRAVINGSTYVTIASYSSPLLSETSYNNITGSHAVNLLEGNNTVAIQWSVTTSFNVSARSEGLRTIRISV